MAPQRDDRLVSLNAAARRLGVHYMTAYRHVRLGQLPAQQRNGRWWVSLTDLEAATRTSPDRGARGRRSSAGWEVRRRRLADRLLAGDLAGSWAIVETSLAAGASSPEIYVQLLSPALEAIGRGWQEGLLSVGQEHRATAVAVRVMGRMSPMFARRGRPSRATVILGGAPGDPHLLPVAMVADVARHYGFRVLELGANVPMGSFVESARQEGGLLAVGLSLSDAACAGAARRLVGEVRSVRPGIAVLAGGPALPSAAAGAALGADYWAPDALAAARLLAGLVSGAGRPAPGAPLAACGERGGP